MEATQRTSKIRRLAWGQEDSLPKTWNATQRRTNATSAGPKDTSPMLVHRGTKIKKLHELQRYLTPQRKQKKHPIMLCLRESKIT